MTSHDDWATYLDPVGDGFDGAENRVDSIPVDEQMVLDRIADGLADPAAWGRPSDSVRSGLFEMIEAESRSSVGETPGSSGPADLRPEPIAADSQAPIDLDQHRRRRDGRLIRMAGSALVGATAAAAVVAFVIAPRLADDRGDFTTYEVAGTELTPDLDATVDVEPLGAGVAITLNIKGLPPAEEGEYYAAWLMRDDMGDDSMGQSDDDSMSEDGMSDDSMSDDSMSDDSMSDDSMSDDGMSDDAMAGDAMGSMMGEMVGIGSFHWREGGIPIELWSGVDTERYPVFMVTVQQEGEPSSASDVVVMTARLDG